MKTLTFDELVGNINLTNLKFPPEWDLMNDEAQERFIRISLFNEEPDKYHRVSATRFCGFDKLLLK